MNLRRIKGVFLRYYYNAIKGPHQISDMLYWPFVDILLWGLTSLWIQKQNSVPGLPLVLMTGLIFWQIAWRGSIDISFNLLQEFWHRNLVNFFSTPLKISEWICGVLLLSLCKLAITISFGSLIVYILYSLNVFTVGWAFIPFAILLFIFGWSLGFVASGIIIYKGHQVEMFAWMIAFVFAPFSGVFYPVATLPLWAQKISWALPTTYVFEGMREILNNQPFPTYYALTSLALSLLYLALAVYFFYYMFKKSLNKGLARLE
ncbi:MAG: ABC transporter permease [Parachlamydiales bacterium]|jgi:ABC-2 type transport system permease protein